MNNYDDEGFADVQRPTKNWKVVIHYDSGRVQIYYVESQTKPSVPAEGRWWKLNKTVTVNLNKVESVEVTLR